jgi:hypothetical protein
METLSFDFKKKENIILTVDENVILHLEQIANSYCVLYFTDATQESETYPNIIIPQDIVVYDTVYNDTHLISHPIPARKYYYLSWTENYLVKYKSQMIMNIHNPRIWEIDLKNTKTI